MDSLLSEKCLHLCAAIALVGCSGGPIDSTAGTDKRNGFCSDENFTIEFTGEYSGLTSPSYPEGRSELNLFWSPPEAGTWQFTLDGVDPESWPGVTLAKPLCDEGDDLPQDAFDPMVGRDRATITYDVADTDLRRIWVDVRDEQAPQGLMVTLRAVFLRESAACGLEHQPCCPGSACNTSLRCEDGQCVQPDDPMVREGTACGLEHQPCCPGSACNASLWCEDDQCVGPPEPIPYRPCEAEVSCWDCTHRPGCGWCDGECMEGDANGAAGADAPVRCVDGAEWLWTYPECLGPMPAW